MASKKCSKKIVIDGIKVPFKGHVVYALVNGELVRIRHRDQVPLDPSGQGVTVYWADAKTTKRNPRMRLTGYAAWELELLAIPEGWQSGKVKGGKLPAGRAFTGEGGLGHKRGPLDELRVLASNNRANDTFYESAAQRAERSRALTKKLAKTDPEGLRELVENLVNVQRLRTSALSVAIDAAVAGHPDGAALITLALNRPDDPGLALQYAKDTYGRVPQSVRAAARGGAVRLYDENAAIRYDHKRTRSVTGEQTRNGGGFTFADVIRVTHPIPADAKQAALFAHLVNGTEPGEETLPLLYGRKKLQTLGQEEKLQAYTGALDAVRAYYQTGQRPNPEDHDAVTRTLLSGDWRTLTQNAPAPDETLTGLAAAAQAELDLIRSAELDARRERNWAKRANKNLLKAEKAGDMEGAARWATEVKAAQDRYDQYNETRAQALAKARETHEAAAKAKQSLAVEVALASMSYKDVLTNLVKLSNEHVSELARNWAKTRVEDAEAAKKANLSLSDVIRAGKAAAEAAGGEKDPYSWRMSWTDTPTEWDGPLSTVTRNLVADSLAPLADKKVLVLVDGSGSMGVEVATRQGDRVSATYSGLRRDEVAAFMAGAFKAGCDGEVDVVTYDTAAHPVEIPEGADAFTATRAAAALVQGGGTDTWRVLLETWDEHDVVVILTDEQTSWTLDEEYNSKYSWNSTATTPRIRKLPKDVQVVTCNLAGDRVAHAGTDRRHVSLAGVTEDVFLQAGLAAKRGSK